MSRDLLQALPNVDGFRRVTQSLAALDAIMSPEWQYRYYSFDASWSQGNIEVASIRDGSGDHWFAVPTNAGAALHGLAEPAFDSSNSTYCIWRLRESDRWSRGDIDAAARDLDGMTEHLPILADGPAGYVQWAEEYYETDVDLADVAAVFWHAEITPDLVTRLNDHANFAALEAELRSIGYLI